MRASIETFDLRVHAGIKLLVGERCSYEWFSDNGRITAMLRYTFGLCVMPTCQAADPRRAQGYF